MAVRIRLQRKGARHMAFYRIVAADARSPRDGRFIEQLGYYDPLRDPPDIKIDTAKVIDWLSKGAQPSGTVESLLRSVGVMQMWHEVKGGKPLDELAHIEDEARKRLEAKASMDRRRKAEAKSKKAAAEDEEAQEPAAAEETVAPDTPDEGAESAAADVPDETEEAAGDSETEPEAPAVEEPAEKVAPDVAAGTDTNDAVTDSGGGASQVEAEGEAPADDASGGDDASSQPEEPKPE